MEVSQGGRFAREKMECAHRLYIANREESRCLTLQAVNRIFRPSLMFRRTREAIPVAGKAQTCSASTGIPMNRRIGPMFERATAMAPSFFDVIALFATRLPVTHREPLPGIRAVPMCESKDVT